MDKLQRGSFPMLVLSFFGMAIHFFVTPIPDWIVRVLGIVMLISMFFLVFSTVRISAKK